MNQSIKTHCLVLMIACIQALPVASQQITKERALEKARQFMTSAQVNPTVPKHAARADAQLTLANNSDDYFVFNDQQNGGWVIVGGDERQQDVLGYSPDGHFDAQHISSNFQWMLDGFAQQAQYLRTHPNEQIEAPRRTQGIVVEPLLKSTWGQGAPYWNMTPVINGQHCLTGCAPTAAAQIMYYHKWPNQGKGQISYFYNDQTFAADFSQSTYQWDLMLPTYDDNSSQASQDAVALLLKDVGYAFNTFYGLGDSPAPISGEPFVEFFDFDLSAQMMERNYCCQESWDSILTEEMVNKRPVFLSGGSPGGGHTMVIDGRDADGYFHFNFGWDGRDNGYFATSKIYYNMSQIIWYGLKKNEGGKPNLAIASEGDFLHESGDILYLNAFARTYYMSGNTERYYAALAVENTSTHQVIYMGEEIFGRYFTMTENLPDGDYILYPVARGEQETEWKKFMFPDRRQSFVDLNVTNGVKTYTNNHIFDGLQDGAYEVDGVYYFLDFDTHEATVTFKNEKHDGYAGDVTIPSHFTYEGTEFTVTAIGSMTFEKAHIGVLTIPNTVKRIESLFSLSHVEKIVFEPGSQLESIIGTCFNGLVIKNMELNLPEGLKELPSHCLQSAQMSWLSLPSTLTAINGTPLNYTANLRYLVVNNPTPVELGENFFTGVDWRSLVTLYVPKGSLDNYQKADMWKEFGQIKEMEDTTTIDGVKYILHDDLTATVFCAYYIDQKDYTLPSTITYQGKDYTVSEIAPFAFISSSCEALTIPATVKYLGEACLYDAQYGFNIMKLSLCSQEPPEVADMKFEGKEGFKLFYTDEVMYSWPELHVPVGSKATYQAHSFWGKYSNIVEDATLGIGAITSLPDGQANQPIYTLSGVRLPATTDLRTLPKGIYLQAGKTIVIK